jgi:hypothetical protein
MLEDIRTHSPIPDEQEIRWIAARPFRQAARVAVLAFVAIIAGNIAAHRSTDAPAPVRVVAADPSR